MLQLNVLQILLLIGFGVSVFLFFSLQSIEERYRKAARYLGYFIVGYIALQINITVIPIIQKEISFIIPHLPILYFLPVFFIFFIMASVDPDLQLNQEYRWLYIPGIIDVIYSLVTWIYVVNMNEGAIYEFITGRSGFIVHESIGIIFTLFCLGVLFHFLNGARLQKNNTYRFYRFVIAGISVILIRWVILFIGNAFELYWYNYRVEQFFYILETFFLLYIGYKILTAPRIISLKGLNKANQITDELRTKAEELKELIIHKKLFLDPNLSRRDLAEEMQESEVIISQLLNEGLNSNFYELVNHYRIEEARMYIEAGRLKEITIQALAHEVGFKSKSTFNKKFREQTGFTPSGYLQELM